jgi:hypothetical protein
MISKITGYEYQLNKFHQMPIDLMMLDFVWLGLFYLSMFQEVVVRTELVEDFIGVELMEVDS